MDRPFPRIGALAGLVGVALGGLGANALLVHVASLSGRACLAPTAI